jgi:hypothetical protein
MPQAESALVRCSHLGTHRCRDVVRPELLRRCCGLPIERDVNELQLRQSWRYGRERLYATDAKGAVLGWWDAASREIRVPVAHHATDVVRLITGWLSREERLGRVPAGTSNGVNLRIGHDWPIRQSLSSAGALLRKAFRLAPPSGRPLAI